MTAIIALCLVPTFAAIAWITYCAIMSRVFERLELPIEEDRPILKVVK